MKVPQPNLSTRPASTLVWQEKSGKHNANPIHTPLILTKPQVNEWFGYPGQTSKTTELIPVILVVNFWWQPHRLLCVLYLDGNLTYQVLVMQ